MEVDFLLLGDFGTVVADFLVDFDPLPVEGVFGVLGDFRGFLPLEVREPADFLLLFDEVSRDVGRGFLGEEPELEALFAEELAGVMNESRLA